VASSACRVSDYYTNRVGSGVWVVDVGEMQIERPKSQKRYGEWQAEMPHDEVAVVSELGTGDYTAVAQGRTHDFKLLKRSRLPFVVSQCLADPRLSGLC